MRLALLRLKSYFPRVGQLTKCGSVDALISLFWYIPSSRNLVCELGIANETFRDYPDVTGQDQMVSH